MNDDVQFSRSGTTHPLGKCSESRLDIPMPEALRDKIVGLATVRGCNAVEWARDVLERQVEGELVFMRRRMHGINPNGDGRNEG